MLSFELHSAYLLLIRFGFQAAEKFLMALASKRRPAMPAAAPVLEGKRVMPKKRVPVAGGPPQAGTAPPGDDVSLLEDEDEKRMKRCALLF